MKCHGCNTTINRGEMLCCSKCRLKYHYMCINLTSAYFREHSHILRRSWECPECLNKLRRANNDRTPVRNQGAMIAQDTGLVNGPTTTAEGSVPDLGETSIPSPVGKTNPLESACQADEASPLSSQLEFLNVTQRRHQRPRYNSESSFLENTLPAGDTLTSSGKEDTNLILLQEIRELKTQITLQAQKQEARDTELVGIIKTLQMGINNINTRHTLIEKELNALRDSITQNIHQINDLHSENNRLQQELLKVKSSGSPSKDQNKSSYPSSSLSEGTQPRTDKSSDSANIPHEKTFVSKQQGKQPQSHHIDNSKMLVLYGLEENEFETEADLYNRVVTAFFDITQTDLTGYIEDMTRIGYRGRRRPLKIEFLSKRMTRYLLRSVNMFRNTGLWVSEFLDENGLQDRKKQRENQRRNQNKTQYNEDQQRERLRQQTREHQHVSYQILDNTRNETRREYNQPFRSRYN